MPTKQAVRVAAAQILVDSDPSANLRRITECITTAARKRSDIVCFPEACLCNDYEDPPAIRDYVEEIRETCHDSSVWSVFGTYERRKGGGVQNMVYLIDREGRIAYIHAKKNLYRDELENGVVAGSESRVLRTELGSLGIIVCFDFAYPEYVKTLSLKGAEIIFCPSFMVDHRGWAEMIRGMPVTRAFETTSYFVLCDAVTVDGRTAAISRIAGPKRTLASIEGREGMIFADLNMPRLRRLKARFAVLRKRG